MKLVEITRTISTDQSVIDTVVDIMKGVDKHPIVVNEGAGFVVNRILIPEINEAIGIYADNIASPSDIDRIRCCVRWFALACSVRSPAVDSLRTSIRLVRKFLAAS